MKLTAWSLRKMIACAILLPVVATFSGCASFNHIANYHSPARQTDVAITDKPLSKMSELPLGAYYDPSRQVVVTGHQKGVFTGMMFGIVGVMVADSMNKSSGKEKFGAEVAKGSDLGTILDGVLDESLAQGQATDWKRVSSNAKLTLTPYAVFTVEKDGNALLYAMLRAEIPGKDGKPVWSGRYFARAAGAHKMDDQGWMSGSLFADAMHAALTQTLKACIDDTEGRLNGTETVNIKGKFPYINTDFKLPGIVVKDDGDTLVVKLAVGDAMVLAGTHVIVRSDFEIEPAKFKDPRS